MLTENLYRLKETELALMYAAFAAKTLYPNLTNPAFDAFVFPLIP
ncbi:hypothetical protein SAMN05216386_1860 [Nitrosospira briensis]|uniref:Uncharacterized protein n=1 Tax=Nitrosospira briensis TaxID=35799 RepID=A0A1I5BX05_9PROT|nr:hypothetical protein SAMN05216386_1860 [Nitrosospira briensis]